MCVCVCVWGGGGGGQICPVTQRHRRIYVPLLQQTTEACEHRLGDVNISTHLSFRLFLVREIWGARSGFDEVSSPVRYKPCGRDGTRMLGDPLSE